MENHSFEGESPNGNPPKEQKDNPPGPSKPRTNSSSDNKDQVKDSIEVSVSIIKDNPVYVGYVPPEQKADEFEDLEPLANEPVQEPCDVRSDPEFQQQTNGRRYGKESQRSVEEPCSLISDPTSIPLLPISKTYPGPPNIPLPAVPKEYPDPPNIPLPAVPKEYPDPPNIPLPAVPKEYPDPPNIPLPAVPEQYPDYDPGQQADNVLAPAQQAPSALSSVWETFVDFYKRVNDFAFQFPFHAFLLTWPLATAIMGALSVNHCKINPYLPYVMLAVGLLGTAAGLQRIYVLIYEKNVRPPRPMNFWPGVRAAEFVIWVLFVIQLYFFFKQSPSFTAGVERYCKPKIFMINIGLICLTFATMIGWIVVNIGVLIHWFLRKNALTST